MASPGLLSAVVPLTMLLDEADEENDIANTTDDTMMTLFMLTMSSLLPSEEKRRIRGYVEDVVPCYSDESFRRMFRMNQATYQAFLQNVKELPQIQPAGPGGREPISVEKQILLTLWYLGGTDTVTKIADRFGLSESTVVMCRDRVLSILITLSDQLIKWPNQQEMIEGKNEFQKKNGFPNIVGAIDGTHIKIKAPKEHHQSYVNRKNFHSLQLQCVCCHNMLFSHVFTGFPGSCHDARVLKNADLWDSGLSKCNMIYHILGDGVYPLRRWLLTPFRDNGHLSPQQKKYNHYHSSNRVVIERAFALLKSRFRRLHFIDTKKVSTAVDIIMSCCVLHNLCIMENDEIEEYLLLAEVDAPA